MPVGSRTKQLQVALKRERLHGWGEGCGDCVRVHRYIWSKPSG
jgi:hypothetical protein